MTDAEKNAEIARKMAEIVAEAHRLAAESEAIFRDIQKLDPVAYADALRKPFAPPLRLIQGGKK